MNELTTLGKVWVEHLTQYSRTDLDDLCEATESAIVEGGGFGWLKPPPRRILENYWRGVLLIPERRLVVGRLGAALARAAQQRGAGLCRHHHRRLRRALGARPRPRPRHDRRDRAARPRDGPRRAQSRPARHPARGDRAL